MKEQLHLEAAQIALQNAEREYARALQNFGKKRAAFCEALPVSEEHPCCVAVLPSGMIAVHVWVENSRNPNQLHIVRPGYFDEDARPRRKFDSEQLGEAK